MKQYDFWKAVSRLTHLLETSKRVNKHMGWDNLVEFAHLDFHKAFDNDSHQRHWGKHRRQGTKQKPRYGLNTGRAGSRNKWSFSSSRLWAAVPYKDEHFTTYFLVWWECVQDFSGLETKPPHCGVPALTSLAALLFHSVHPFLSPFTHLLRGVTLSTPALGFKKY